MKITGNEVLAHYEALASVAQLKMGGRLAVAIMSNIKMLEPHFILNNIIANNFPRNTFFSKS